MTADELEAEMQRRLAAGLLYPTRPIDDQRRALLRLLLRRTDDWVLYDTGNAPRLDPNVEVHPARVIKRVQYLAAQLEIGEPR